VATASRAASAKPAASAEPAASAKPAVSAKLAASATPAAASSPLTEQDDAAAPLDAPMPFVTGRAVHPSDASTEVFARIVEDKGESEGPVRHASTGQVPVVRRATTGTAVGSGSADGAAEQDDEAWSPVPVPRPTYTMKASAPRREPAPLENLEGSTATRTADAETPAGAERAPLEAPVETTGSIDLNAVLAKRRAAGE
jgi:hypothetical protein